MYVVLVNNLKAFENQVSILFFSVTFQLQSQNHICTDLKTLAHLSQLQLNP